MGQRLRFQEAPGSSMTLELRAEAEGWVSDCVWADEFDVSTLTDVALLRGIDRNYAGGWAGFVADVSA